MTDELDGCLRMFRMSTGAEVASLWLPVSRAQPLDAVVVLPAVGGDDARPQRWRPLCVADASAAGGEPLMTFPYAGALRDMVEGRVRWDAVPPAPLPDDGWRDVDQAWWASIEVRDGSVFGAQTDFDAALDALVAHAPLTWSGPGQAQLGDAPVSWFRVPRPAWDDAWRLAVQVLPPPS